MGDHDEIIDLCSTRNAGLFKAGPVDGGISADFNVIFEDDDAELLLFDVFAFFIRSIPKSTGADHSAGLDDNAVAELAAFTDGDVGMEDAVAADFNTRAKGHGRSEECAFFDDAVSINDAARANRHIRGYLSRRMDDSGWMDAVKPEVVFSETEKSLTICWNVSEGLSETR